MINSRHDVIKYLHSIIDQLEVTDWNISQIHLWRMRTHLGKVKKLSTVLMYVEESNEFYFITTENINYILSLRVIDNASTYFVDWDEWPCIPTFSEEEYFQQMTAVQTEIEVLDPDFSLLLKDFIDKIKASDIYKEYHK